MKAAIIGGSGKMGQWFARHLLQEGIEVVITGRNREKLVAAGKKLDVPIATNAEAVKQADVVIISVPPDNFESVVKGIAPYARQEQIFLDVTSLKTNPGGNNAPIYQQGHNTGDPPCFRARGQESFQSKLRPHTDK